MVVFGFMVRDLDGITRYIEEVNEKFKGENILKNPFVDSFIKEVHAIPSDATFYYIAKINPMYPRLTISIPTMITLIAVLIYVLFFQSLWTFLFPVLCWGYFYISSGDFFFRMFKIGLKKKRNVSHIVKVSDADMLTLMVEKCLK